MFNLPPRLGLSNLEALIRLETAYKIVARMFAFLHFSFDIMICLLIWGNAMLPSRPATFNTGRSSA
jgi:hypothetical protein